MRNAGEALPDVTRNGSAGAWATPDVTRNGKCAAHMSYVSFRAAFGSCIKAREP
jgi:hypothetical protein